MNFGERKNSFVSVKLNLNMLMLIVSVTFLIVAQNILSFLNSDGKYFSHIYCISFSVFCESNLTC